MTTWQMHPHFILYTTHFFMAANFTYLFKINIYTAIVFALPFGISSVLL